MTGSEGLPGSALRDLGGLRARDGRRIRAGVLFRSGAIAPVASGEGALLHAAGLKLVCDLRGEAERRAHAISSWPAPAPRTVLLGLDALEEGTALCSAALVRNPCAQTARALMMRTYELLPHACAPRLGALIEALAGGEVPALIHCTAGKDRTGFVVAALLSALQVPREAILADYLQSARADRVAVAHARTARIMQLLLGRALDDATVAVLSTVEPGFLETSFTVVEREYGSMDQYLVHAAGINVAVRDRLQRVLLEASADGV